MGKKRLRAFTRQGHSSHNPKAIGLYRELGKIFSAQNRQQQRRRQQILQDPACPCDGTLLGNADNAWFESLAKAPADWSQIVADTDVTPFIAALKAADKNFEDDSRFVGNYLSLRENPSRFDPAAFKVIDRFRGTK